MSRRNGVARLPQDLVTAREVQRSGSGREPGAGRVRVLGRRRTGCDHVRYRHWRLAQVLGPPEKARRRHRRQGVVAFTELSLSGPPEGPQGRVPLRSEAASCAAAACPRGSRARATAAQMDALAPSISSHTLRPGPARCRNQGSGCSHWAAPGASTWARRHRRDGLQAARRRTRRVLGPRRGEGDQWSALLRERPRSASIRRSPREAAGSPSRWLLRRGARR